MGFSPHTFNEHFGLWEYVVGRTALGNEELMTNVHRIMTALGREIANSGGDSLMGVKAPDYGERWQGLEVSKIPLLFQRFVYFYFRCMGVLPAPMCTSAMCVWYSLRPEDLLGPQLQMCEPPHGCWGC